MPSLKSIHYTHQICSFFSIYCECQPLPFNNVLDVIVSKLTPAKNNDNLSFEVNLFRILKDVALMNIQLKIIFL